MNIPKDSDWGAYEKDLDVKAAYHRFAGKQFDALLDEYHNNPIEMTDELRFMPKVPFQYYIISFKHYVCSELSKNDSDAASCYLRLIEEKLEKQPSYILPIMDKLLDSVKHVANNQNYYDADIDIYGDFILILKNIEKFC